MHYIIRNWASNLLKYFFEKWGKGGNCLVIQFYSFFRKDVNNTEINGSSL